MRDLPAVRHSNGSTLFQAVQLRDGGSLSAWDPEGLSEAGTRCQPVMNVSFEKEMDLCFVNVLTFWSILILQHNMINTERHRLLLPDLR